MIPYEKLPEIFRLGEITISSKGRIKEMNEMALTIFGRGDDGASRFIFQICPEWSIKHLRKMSDELVIHGQIVKQLEYSDVTGNYSDALTLLLPGPKKGEIHLIFNKLGRDSAEESEIIRTSIDQIDQMIFWVRPDASVAYCNQRAAGDTGYSLETILSGDIGKFDKNYSRRDYIDLFETLKKKRYIERDSIFIRKDGSEFPVRLTCNKVVYRQLSFNCLIAKDITQALRLQNRLEEYKFALDNSKIICIWVNKEGQIVYANQAACKRYGYPKEKFTTLKASDINRTMSKADMKDQIRSVAEEEDWIKESEHTTADGSIFPVEVAATQLETRDRDLNILFITDITKRRTQVLQDKKMMDHITTLKDRLKEENEYLIGELTDRESFENIISTSPAYEPVLKRVQQVAETNSTVLITGETGTGKELLARAIHRLSDRADRSLIRINCSTLPKDLIESELFGHRRGAFTGAFQDRKGRFELANGGTVFLDEIGELPLELQPKLLRVIQEGEFERLGDPETVEVDVRIIAATNRDLVREIKKKRFRQDLYYRLNVFPIHNLPLRERKEDIPILTQHFIEKYCKKIGKPTLKIRKGLINKLMSYDFPGNIRELENIIERSVVLSQGTMLKVDLSILTESSENNEPDDFLSLEAAQREHIIEALNRCRWKVTGPNSASELLNINGKTLASKMRKLSINKYDYI